VSASRAFHEVVDQLFRLEGDSLGARRSDDRVAYAVAGQRPKQIESARDFAAEAWESGDSADEVSAERRQDTNVRRLLGKVEENLTKNGAFFGIRERDQLFELVDEKDDLGGAVAISNRSRELGGLFASSR